MTQELKFYCKSSTYVDNLNLSKDYSKLDNVLCGYKNQFEYTNYFSSIFNFSKLDLDISLVRSAFLFIYITEINSLKEFPTNLCLTSSLETLNVADINYKNFMENIVTKPLPINFHSKKINTYVKINITSIIKELINNNSNFNIIIKTINEYPTYFLNINSSSSKYPPYIEIKMMDKKLENSIYSVDNNINIYSDIFKKIEEQNTIISNLTKQILDIHDLLKSLNNKFIDFNNTEKITNNKDISKNTSLSKNKEELFITPTSKNTNSAIKVINKNNSSRIMLSTKKENN